MADNKKKSGFWDWFGGKDEAEPTPTPQATPRPTEDEDLEMIKNIPGFGSAGRKNRK